MRILVLHKNKEHIEECAAVLNEEWPRSKTARCSIYLKTENNYLRVLQRQSESRSKVIDLKKKPFN
jgi:hypothetical protein